MKSYASAFPIAPRTHSGGAQDGMTILDYFAGRSLVGIISNEKLYEYVIKQAREKGVSVPKAVSEMAYDCAEEMIEEKRRREY